MIRVGHAEVVHRAEFAFRFGAGTDDRPQIHHRLVEAFNAFRWRHCFADLPQAFLDLFLTRPAAHCVAARQHAFHVTVEDREMFTE
ncbi:hypothetical protein D3C76_1307800 [compost metagenome]